MVSFLEFEKPIAELEARIVELRATASVGDINIDGEIGTLEQRAAKLLADTYAKLTPWQKTQVARHSDRPHFKDYVAGLFDNFMPLAGDRAFADDQAILGGFATLGFAIGCFDADPEQAFAEVEQAIEHLGEGKPWPQGLLIEIESLLA